MRTWSNARGEGQLFSIDLLDEDGSEIRGTFFKADAEKWINVLTEGQVYSFNGGRVKVRFAGRRAERGWDSLYQLRETTQRNGTKRKYFGRE